MQLCTIFVKKALTKANSFGIYYYMVNEGVQLFKIARYDYNKMIDEFLFVVDFDSHKMYLHEYTCNGRTMWKGSPDIPVDRNRVPITDEILQQAKKIAFKSLL